MIIVLIGPPASGKGTIGKLLSEKLSLPLVNVGKMLREIPRESIWYDSINQAMDKGNLAPNSIVGGFLEEVVKDSRYENGYILDGWIRQMSDLEQFDPCPNYVVFIDASKEVSQERVLSRRVCEEKQHSYNLISNPPKKKGICDIDGSKLIRRDDDTAEVLEHRWREYEERTLPVVEYYRGKGLLKEVLSEGTPQEVFDRLTKVLGII